jgi:eukaryotic-like serine/threonine-protein kinase
MSDQLHPGSRLGNYQLLAPIGRGGMATVWVARAVEGAERGSRVAVKVILAPLAGDPEFKKMFVDEGRLARRIRHPNVVEVYDVREHLGTPYISMEWIEGESSHALLTETSRRRLVTPAMAMSVVAKVAAGLELAHDLTGDDGTLLGVVHRDVSPHNILLRIDGAVKLVDFGVAKARGRLAEATSAGQLKGKFGYMSPEQGTDRPVDRRSDTFSLGIVLFELTTGKRLFRGRNEAETLRLVTSAEIPRPTSIVADYPKRLERIVLKALEREPIRRYQSAAALEHDLEECLARSRMWVEERALARLLEQVFGERIRQRRTELERAELALEGAPRSVVVPAVRPAPVAVELVPDSSRTPLNSSAEIETRARGTLAYTLALGAAAVALVLGLSLSLRWFPIETSETSRAARLSVFPRAAAQRALALLQNQQRRAPAAPPGPGFCMNPAPAAPASAPAACEAAPARTQDGEKLRGLR